MYYTQDEVLQLLGWSRSTLLRHRKAGTFPAPHDPDAKPLHWLMAAVDAWLDADAARPPNPIEQMIARKYPDELEQAIADCTDAANDQVDSDYADGIEEQIREHIAETITDYRDDALVDAIAELPDADDTTIEEHAATLAQGRARAAARNAVLAELGPEIAARKRRIARRDAMALMRVWLQRGRPDHF